ncbi:EVE domain-containing protein [Gammaproteobacteria bacterium]|nr:EVE domain-containing protein [Gammaproteobacteria bacterium]
MNYWLMKSEPDVFSIDDLEARGAAGEPWDGIRNYQARNFLRDTMAIGDLSFFYHSNTAVPGIVGVMETISEPYPDPTQFDSNSNYFDAKSDPANPRWLLRDFRFVKKFPHTISLAQTKAMPELAEMRLVQRGNRLSIMPVEPEHWQIILNLV